VKDLAAYAFGSVNDGTMEFHRKQVTAELGVESVSAEIGGRTA
jgi:hypothetical protein